MSDRSRKLSSQSFVLIAALAFVFILLVLSMTAVTAQDSSGTGTPGLEFTAQPTSEFDLNLLPTFAPPTGTVDPNDLPSLSGVGGQAVNANVAIRSGPGREFPRISYLKKDGWIDIVGWNGWKDGRICTTDFEGDLDMWVQVQFGSGQRGWIARCVLDIRGRLTLLPIVTADGERILQR